MKGSLGTTLVLVALGLIQGGVASSALMADPVGLGLRLSGGYGFSMDTQQNQSVVSNITSVEDISFAESYSNAAVPVSQGIPAQAELLYSITPGIQVGLGVFPVFRSVNWTTTDNHADIYGGPGGTYSDGRTVVENSYAQSTNSFPVLADFYFNHALAYGFTAFVGFGLGVVPASTVAEHYTQTVSGTTGPGLAQSGNPPALNLDAAFAVRGVAGTEYMFNSHFRIGLQVQDLVFDQEAIEKSSPLNPGDALGGGWQGSTEDFNQWAPMLFVEGDL